MIDPRIPLMGQQQADPFESAAKGIQFGQGLRQLLSGRQAGKMAALNPEERQAFANNSMFSRELNAQLKADKAAEVQALRDQQKHDADIYNTRAQGGERIANAGKTTQETTVNRQRAMSSALAAAMRGDPRAANFMLEHGKTGGVIDDASYEQAKQFLTTNANNPEAISSLVESLGITAAENPEQYIQPDANNVNTNATSIKNNELDNQTSRERLKQEGEQYQQNFEYTAQQDEIKNGQAELKEFGGKTWIVYKNGDYRPAIGADGNQISASKAETPEQKMQRVDNALGAADAARAAARASQDAANLINDPGLYWGTGTTSALGLIPGSDAKGFHARLENLKSQVFLPTVKALQGMGALSNAEGEKISAAVANLDPKIGPEAMKEQLTVLAKQMRDAAKIANQRTQNYASRGGTIPLSVTSKKRGANENPPPKGSSASLSEVKQAAQQAGISTEEMASILKSQGVSIK
ncbi:hypothetical protein [Acinetobacter sp. YH12086]|uniref:hypothetical protein n=1 Tax=Acinetobacter sp. YH12086 TaxID=2601078 RepID=UPI0015D29733|nr:hypothetical protein [Acinetobacter sp. YH12086]